MIFNTPYAQGNKKPNIIGRYRLTLITAYIQGIPQGSILGLALYTLDINASSYSLFCVRNMIDRDKKPVGGQVRRTGI